MASRIRFFNAGQKTEPTKIDPHNGHPTILHKSQCIQDGSISAHSNKKVDFFYAEIQVVFKNTNLATEIHHFLQFLKKRFVNKGNDLFLKQNIEQILKVGEVFFS